MGLPLCMVLVRDASYFHRIVIMIRLILMIFGIGSHIHTILGIGISHIYTIPGIGISHTLELLHHFFQFTPDHHGGHLH